jgi:NAD dependent epimerase/dehydratase
MSGSRRAVLVTGAGGFIGSHLVARLVRGGERVRALLRYSSRDHRGALSVLPAEVTTEVEVVVGDLRDVESVNRAAEGMQVVFHLGAQVAIPYSYANPRTFFETNVLGSLNVAQAALSAGVERLVHASTSEVYGSARFVPMTEDHPMEPHSPYAASKVGADSLMLSFHRSFGLPVTIVRPFNTYGPLQSARAILPTIIAQALASADGTPLRLGALEPRRDLTYVSDTIAGFTGAGESPGAVGQTLQLGTGVEVSVAELVEIVGDVLGKRLRVVADPERMRPAHSELERQVSDPRRAREAIGWDPKVDLREGIERTVEWVRGHQQELRPGEYVI